MYGDAAHYSVFRRKKNPHLEILPSTDDLICDKQSKLLFAEFRKLTTIVASSATHYYHNS